MKGTKLYSVFTGTCPGCQEHKVFYAGPYKLSKMTKMHKKCPNCGRNLMPEPSFYTGATYVSYAFSVAIVVIVFTAFNVLEESPSVDGMVFFAVSIAVILAPLNFRLSRMIWANIFIDYNQQ